MPWSSHQHLTQLRVCPGAVNHIHIHRSNRRHAYVSPDPSHFLSPCRDAGPLIHILHSLPDALVRHLVWPRDACMHTESATKHEEKLAGSRRPKHASGALAPSALSCGLGRSCGGQKDLTVSSGITLASNTSGKLTWGEGEIKGRVLARSCDALRVLLRRLHAKTTQKTGAK